MRRMRQQQAMVGGGPGRFHRVLPRRLFRLKTQCPVRAFPLCVAEEEEEEEEEGMKMMMMMMRRKKQREGKQPSSSLTTGLAK